MPMFSQIKSHLTKNPAISKIGPHIGNDVVQQSNFGHKCPVSGITKSLCVFREKNCTFSWVSAPHDTLNLKLSWADALQNQQLGSPFGRCKHTFHNTTLSFEIWGVLGKLSMFIQIKPHRCPCWVKLSRIGTRTQQYISKVWSWY